VVLLLFGLVPVLARSQSFAAPVNQWSKASLTPFIHVTNSTVQTLNDAVGYVDSVVNITNGVLTGTYTNTTDNVNDTSTITNYKLTTISFYGSSQVVIKNSSFPETTIRVFDSSVVTITNSTVYAVEACNSSQVAINDSSTVTGYVKTYAYSEVNITASTINETRTYGSSRVRLLGSSSVLKVYLCEESYLESSGCTITNFNATGFATALITGGSITSTFYSLDAANVTLDGVSGLRTVNYGLVCTQGSLNITGSTANGLDNCTYTVTFLNMAPPQRALVSVSAVSEATVNITNNYTISYVYAHNSSGVNLQYFKPPENAQINCYDSSNVTIIDSGNVSLYFYCWDSSQLTMKNVTFYEHYVYTFDAATVFIENATLSGKVKTWAHGGNVFARYLNFSGANAGFWAYGYGLSVIEIDNVTSNMAPVEIYSYDLSVVNIMNSNVTVCGYSVQSDGNMAVANGVLGGSYVNNTNWDTKPETVFLNSIAVVGGDNLTINDCNFNVSVFVHEDATANVQNTVFTYSSKGVTFRVLNESWVTALNVSFQEVLMYDFSGGELTNVTIDQSITIRGAVTLTLVGSPTATTTINTLEAASYFPDLSNISINQCSVTKITGTHWITSIVVVDYTLPFILYYGSFMMTQNLTTILNMGIPIGIVGVALAIAVYFLAKQS